MAGKINGQAAWGIGGVIAGVVTTIIMMLAFLQVPLQEVKADISQIRQDVGENKIAIAVLQETRTQVREINNKVDQLLERERGDKR